MPGQSPADAFSGFLQPEAASGGKTRQVPRQEAESSTKPLGTAEVLEALADGRRHEADEVLSHISLAVLQFAQTVNSLKQAQLITVSGDHDEYVELTDQGRELLRATAGRSPVT